MDEVLLRWCRRVGLNSQMIEDGVPIQVWVNASELRTLVRQVRKDERRKTEDKIKRNREEHRRLDNGK